MTDMPGARKGEPHQDSNTGLESAVSHTAHSISWERTCAVLIEDARLSGDDFGAMLREKFRAQISMGRELDTFAEDNFFLTDRNADGKLSLKELEEIKAKLPDGRYKDAVKFMIKQYDKIETLSDDQKLWEDGITRKDIEKFGAKAQNSLNHLVGFTMERKIKNGELESLRTLAKEGEENPAAVISEFDKTLEADTGSNQLKGKHFVEQRNGQDTIVFRFQNDGWRVDVPSNPNEEVRGYKSFRTDMYSEKKWAPTDVSQAWSSVCREANINRSTK